MAFWRITGRQTLKIRHQAAGQDPRTSDQAEVPGPTGPDTRRLHHSPPKGSPRKLASEFAIFLGLPPRPRQKVTDIADAVCQVLTMARTDRVIVDEIHNLNLATSVGEDMSDHLKYFAEHMPATFVLQGSTLKTPDFPRDCGAGKYLPAPC